jgi:signal transduction histidine kinase/CheY-like chemotaxis protein
VPATESWPAPRSLGDETERVVVWARGQRDSELTCELLARDGVDAIACTTVARVVSAILEGAAVLLITEDVLDRDALAKLRELLDKQPPWSDFPVLIFGADRDGLRASNDPIRALGNVTLLERPVRVRSMLAAVHSAIRARRRQYQARRAIAARDQFLAMLGHELRNPLGAIRFAVELNQHADARRSSKPMDVIDRQSRHLMKLVDDLLDVARITHGKVVLQREPVDLVETLKGVCAAIEPLAKARDLVVTVRSAESSAPIEGDRLRVEQIFGNLVTNAVKYTAAGGHVTVEVAVEQGQAIVRVRDTGIGISADMLAHVFDVFSQADRTLDRASGGLGLGLAVVKSLVELHGGKVEARSDGIGRGSEFVVSLGPVIDRVSDVAPRPSTRSDVDRRRVVAVEDNEDMREMLAELLSLGGHELSLAADGPGGLARILEDRPDVAFVDVGLPGFDGFEVARRARAAGSTAHLVAVTGYGRAEDRERARAAGFDAHLTKPVNIAQLDEVLRRRRLG